MSKTKFLNLLLFVLAGSVLFAQSDKKNNKNYDSPLDFRVISSNSSYVEFEFTPKYTSSVEFLNAAHNSSLTGKPDLGSRNFPVITPGEVNNRIEIIDVKYEDLLNVDVKPVPTPKRGNNKLEVLYEYNYDNTVYSSNALYPKVNAEFIQDGKFRNKYFGLAQIYPVQFNPLNKSVRRITYIRVRVAYGKSPVYSAKPQSKLETDFLRGISINWENSINWVTPEFNSYKATIQNSVLATGDFFKMEVKETGIYRIDKNFLSSAGINTANIDPRTIKIYGNGGRELPYLNSAPVPEDLVQNPIYVSGESDGVFNDNDFILFYGLSPHQWIQQGSSYFHKLNTYSNVNYYWITYGGSNGIRMPEIQSSNLPNISPLGSFTDKIYDEPEVNNLGSTGNLWVSQRIGYGEPFSFSKQLPGYLSGTDIKCKLVLGNGTINSDAYYSVTDNNSGFSNAYSVYAVNGVFSHISLSEVNFQYPLNSGSSMNLKATLTQAYNVPTVSGYYDYLEVFYSRGLNTAENNLLKISSFDTVGTIEYQVSPFNSSTVKVFKVASQTDIKIVNPISYSGGTVRFQDNANLITSVKDFYVAGDNSYKTPVSITGKVPNQNLRGISDGADYIIYTTSDFVSAANRIKAQKEAPGEGSPNYLKTIVIDINQVYNEFSGGLTDPVAMRNFLKYAYNNWVRRPMYVLFLGDGSFDYKNIFNLSSKNFVPPIERTDPGMNEISSYNSDDFITDINEDYPSPEAVRTDFSSGRFCINTLRDANAIVDKIIQYESSQNIGIWKKKIMYCADDGWTTENNQGEEGDLHTRQCETIAETYTTKDFEKEKVYIVSYPAVITPQGRRKPGANIDIIKGWNEGRLLINWTGHGSIDLWAHEHVFVKDESIPLMKNKNRYPIVTIASCDLARWDDPFIISAAEQLVYIPEAGAAAVIAATRPVYANYNEIFNNTLWNNIMFYKDTLNLPIRIGKAMYNVKNQLSSIGENDMKFCLIGDPTLRVSIPQYFTRIDSINSKSIVNDTAIVKSLQRMRISGSILKTDSTFWNNFNGDIDLKVLDVDKNITILDFGRTFNYRLDGGTIYKGTAKVVNGLWSIEFIVPKDISYNSGNGKILGYFNNTSYEGSGYTDKFILSGLDTNAVADTIGPQISLFMDSRNFRSGDVVNQNAKLIADLFDVSGINLTGTIGHKIEAVLNNNDNNKLDLTQYYNTTNGYQYGSVEYSFDGLPDGSYSLRFKAWDTYNNFKETSVNFEVKSTSSLVVSNLFNYPNPMKDMTNFTFQHNFDIPLSADIYIYSVAGRKIQTIKRTNIIGKSVSIEWDGKDADGDYIANGTYIYKVIIKSEDGSFSNVQTGKLAKLK
ncbi:MAG: type IX secretion system sortase PorU [Ignavibacteria bacterium]